MMNVETDLMKLAVVGSTAVYRNIQVVSVQKFEVAYMLLYLLAI